MPMNDYNQRLIADCTSDIEKIKEWINHHPTDSLIKYLVPYAVVRVSGTIEYVFKQMVYEYLSAGAGKDTKSYLAHMIIDSPSNPKTDMIKSIVQNFNGDKAKNFESSLTQEEKGQLNSLVALRNDVAHGRSINTSIQSIANAMKAGISILEKLERILS